MAVSLRCLGHTQKSTQKFEHSRTSLAFLSDQQNEWTAYIDIQLAEQHRCAGNFKEAHRLLSSSLEYFQAQSPSSKIQAHVAQILVRQSLVYEAEQNKMMQSAFGAAAQAVWSELVSEDQKANDSAHVSLSIESRIQKDVDELLDPWYR
ncbi:MAG: hypothetical protein M1822_004346 [Bathelium mastoideum]|nr:MAG: hypothetical protein M1822_004346 [Bathelium mastoideum]